MEVNIGVFYFVLLLYHIPEYIIHKKLHPKETSSKNFLFSYDYVIFYMLSMLEVAIGRECLEDIHQAIYIYTCILGLLIIIMGFIIRGAAIYQMGKTYNHYITVKPYQENIITNGIFRYMRHPCYVAFFLIQVGLQIYIQNAISTILFAAKLHNFFKFRIQREEKILMAHFPEEYQKYKDEVKFGCFWNKYQNIMFEKNAGSIMISLL